MPFERKILKLAPSGFNFDLPVDVAPPGAFTEGNNFQFKNGIATRSLGYAQVFGTPIAAPEYLINIQTVLVNYWLYPCKSVVGVTDGNAHFDVTPAAPLTPTTNNNQWTGDVLNDIPVINNDLNYPMYWPLNTGLDCVTLPGWPVNTYAKAVRSFKYHLIAMNIRNASGNFGDLILWSNAAEPGAVPNSWTPTPSNEAGSAILADTPGDIIDGFALRDMFIIFKPTSMYALTYIGGNDVFSIRKINDTIGMLTRNCAANLHGVTVVLTGNDVVAVDGNSVRSLIDKKLRTWLFSQLDPVNYVNCYVAADPAKSEIWVCIVPTGFITPTVALVWSMDSDDWGIRAIPGASHIAPGIVAPNTGVPTYDTTPYTYDAAPGIYDSPNYTVATETLLMASASKFFNIDAAVTADGVPVQGSVSKSGLDMGLPQFFKLLKRVWPRIDASPGTVVRVRVGAHNAPDDPVAWGSPVDYIVGTTDKIDAFANGRYLAVNFQSDGLPVWRITGFDIEYSYGGAA